MNLISSLHCIASQGVWKGFRLCIRELEAHSALVQLDEEGYHSMNDMNEICDSTSVI